MGAIVTQSEKIQLHITNKNDKRHSHTLTLRAASDSEVTILCCVMFLDLTVNICQADDWNDALCSEVERMNIVAIQNGSRVPEVVEWYYQHQSEVVKRNAFLSDAVLVDLHYTVPGRLGVQSTTKFNISVSSSSTAYFLRFRKTLMSHVLVYR